MSILVNRGWRLIELEAFVAWTIFVIAIVGFIILPVSIEYYCEYKEKKNESKRNSYGSKKDD